MKTAFSFVVLRYVHDIVTGEFINVGVALYAPDAKYIGGLFNTRYGRVNKMFSGVDTRYFRSLMRYIETRFEKFGENLKNTLPIFEDPADILQIANSILTPDDSSLQWSEVGGGITENPSKTLKNLFERIVTHYDTQIQPQSRDDGDVWRVFRKEFETRNILSWLQPKRIIAKDYDYEFQHAWKNNNWHVYEPMSFDFIDPESITNKAHRWLGRITTLRESTEKFKLYILLGEPSLDKHRMTFVRAENILNKIPGDKEFIKENDADKFSEALATEISSHLKK
ncbi:MAG TPA: DUF3037 domain-containing protein [Deltaproteobacteria bacterium]|nr:DUF3037 domain-containing protein [Deltaproteobacteria bacterium]